MKRFAVAAAFAISLAGFALPASADELTDAYARVLANPADSQANIAYAMIAEERKEWRKALGAYERVLLNDPDNEVAKTGIVRVRRIIQPAITQIFAEAGETFETNPRATPTSSGDDYVTYGQLRIKDERPINGVRWRSIATAYGEFYVHNDDLNYAHASVETGPLIDLGSTMLALYPSVGGAVAFTDDRFFYAEANASAMLEGYLNGAYQWARARIGYRMFDPSFTSTNGLYAELRGKWSVANIAHDNDLASIAPWILWSDVGGNIQDTNGINTFSPGQYISGGVTLEYSKKINDKLTVALNVKFSGKHYRVDLAPDGSAREDLLIAPGATLIFTDALGPQTDLRLNYRYDHNNSNDPAHTYENHSLTGAVVFRR